MPLVPLRPVLDATVKYGYAQGAFNVNAVAQAEAVIAVHEMFRSPAILQGADLANAFMGGRVDFANGTLEDKKKGARNIAEAVKKFAEQSPIPVVLHLDHGKNFDSCVAAIEGGYTSVMIDGSSLPFEENVELTREVVKYAHARGVSVEGELGVLAGVEDHVFAANSTYTNPLSAIEFFKKTGVDALAISYGTMHGASKGKDVKLRREIPGITLRTTLIAGFPGETEEQFEDLCNFVKEVKFDRLGCFAYSAEENTVAARMDGQIDQETKDRRAELVMQIQTGIMAQKQAEKVGQTVHVLCDGIDEESGLYLCRTTGDAPEVDGNVCVSSEEPLYPGQFYDVLVDDSDLYDLYGTVAK